MISYTVGFELSGDYVSGGYNINNFMCHTMHYAVRISKYGENTQEGACHVFRKTLSVFAHENLLCVDSFFTFPALCF